MVNLQLEEIAHPTIIDHFCFLLQLLLFFYKLEETVKAFIMHNPTVSKPLII